MSTTTKTDMCLGNEIKPNQIIHHAGRNTFYFVTNMCLMKEPNGEWVDGAVYISAQRIGNGSYEYDLTDIAKGKVFVRPLSKFDADWAIIG